MGWSQRSREGPGAATLTRKERAAVQRLGEQGTDSLGPGGQGHPDLVNEGRWGHREPRAQHDSTTSNGAFYRAGKMGTPRERVWRGGESEFGLKSSLELGFCELGCISAEISRAEKLMSVCLHLRLFLGSHGRCLVLVKALPL